MRELTSLDNETHAKRLVAYLAVKGIATTLDTSEGEWQVWYHDDDQRDEAKSILEAFQANPDAAEYEAAERKVRSVLKEADRLRQSQATAAKQLQKRWSGSWWHCYPATYILIGLCCVVAVVTTDWSKGETGMMGMPAVCNRIDSVLLQKMYVQSMVAVPLGDAIGYSYLRPPEFGEGSIPAVLGQKVQYAAESFSRSFQSGEVWRPVTPAFLHGDLLHLLMNMLAISSFGRIIEFSRGTGRFLLLCLFLAVASSFVQLAWAGPLFVGLSGVILGLVGYAWMKGHYEPQHGIGLSQRGVVMVMFFLVMCTTGAFGPIANGAHIGGFVAGMAVGAGGAIVRKLKRSS